MCSAVSFPLLHRQSAESIPGTLAEARNLRRPIRPVLAWKSAELSAFLSWLYSFRLLLSGCPSAATLSGQLLFLARSWCHCSLHSDNIAFPWPPCSCSLCAAH